MAKLCCLIFVVVTAVLLANSHVGAEELPTEFVPMFEKCERGSAMDGYMCLIDVLSDLDRMLKQSLDDANARVDSQWGAEANAEIREQLVTSQVFWRAYRQEYCAAAAGYYTGAQIHPPSQSQTIMNCRARKTVDRILEIRRDYPAP
jgi:uncharacterized protein YecT (DUF1311 family)